MSNTKVRAIAFYLPQFHPIPENDHWWGKGFTEWTNVAKARPLFKGHYQPRIPADLGFYDLRVPEVREEQAAMASYAGIEGFAYWHYWFGGKRLLERPFQEVLSSGKPDFPFCLAWANETWSGVWHGNPEHVLMKQTYPGEEDFIKHFETVLPAFLDKRYIRVNGRPLFYIYAPEQIPDTQAFMDCWQKLAKQNGLPGIYFVGRSWQQDMTTKLKKLGYDGVQTNRVGDALRQINPFLTFWNRLSRKLLRDRFVMDRWRFDRLSPYLTTPEDEQPGIFPTILSGWDNSPRSGTKARVFTHFNPDVFETHIKRVMEVVKSKEKETNIVFLRSWNEWAEGNYVEPDMLHGWGLLDVLNRNLYSKL